MFESFFLSLELAFDDLLDNTTASFEKNMDRLGDDIVKTVNHIKNGSISDIPDMIKEDIETNLERVEEDLNEW